MKKYIFCSCLIIVTSIFQINIIYSQSTQHNCGQHKVLKELLKDSDFKAYYDQEQRALSSTTQSAIAKSGIVYKIPVVFHIIHNNGVEKIDRSQVLDALELKDGKSQKKLIEADLKNHMN